MSFSQHPPSVTSAGTPHPPVPLPIGQFEKVGEVLRAPFGQDPLWIHQPATNPFNMGTAEQAITLPHLRLLFFNKTSCSEKMIFYVFRIVNLCKSFQEDAMNLIWDLQCNQILFFWELSWVVIHVAHCTSTPPPWHGRHLSPSCDLRSSVQQDCIGKLLGFEAFPWDFNYVYLFSLCRSDNFRMCYSACERGRWSCLTSELSWKPVDCDWLLVDSGASFSASSWVPVKLQATMAGPHRFLLIRMFFLLRIEAVFLWTLSQLLKLSFGHGINMIVVKSRSKCILLAWLRIMSWIIHVLSLGSILCHVMSGSFWIQTAVLNCSQIVFKWWFNFFSENCQWCKLRFWCWPKFYWRKPQSRSSMTCNLQPVCSAYNRNGRAGSSSVSDLPPQWFWFQKTAVRCWFWSCWSPKKWDASWWPLRSTRSSS